MEMIEIGEKINYPTSVMMGNGQMGLCLIAESKFDKATDFINKAEEIARKLQAEYYLLQYLEAGAEINTYKKNFTEAIQKISEAEKIAKNIDNYYYLQKLKLMYHSVIFYQSNEKKQHQILKELDRG